MGDGQLELDALVEIVLKKPYNGSERIPQSILEDRNRQLSILLEEDSDNRDHSEESTVQKSVASGSLSPSQAFASKDILKSKQESITKEQTSESDGAITTSTPPPPPPAPPSNAHEILAKKQDLVSEERVVGPKKQLFGFLFS